MALLPSLTSKLITSNALRSVRHKSRSVPALFWDSPFKNRRSLLDLDPIDLWRHPDPFDLLFPASRTRDFFRPTYELLEHTNINPKEDFQVSLDVHHFAPNEITVKLVDDSIVVEAKHEERSDGDQEGYVSRHFTRRYQLPENYNINDVVSTLSSDGILTVKAPLKAVEAEAKNVREIPVQQTGPAHLNVAKPEKAEESSTGDEKKNTEKDSKNTEKDSN